MLAMKVKGTSFASVAILVVLLSPLLKIPEQSVTSSSSSCCNTSACVHLVKTSLFCGCMRPSKGSTVRVKLRCTIERIFAHTPQGGTGESPLGMHDRANTFPTFLCGCMRPIHVGKAPCTIAFAHQAQCGAGKVPLACTSRQRRHVHTKMNAHRPRMSQLAASGRACLSAWSRGTEAGRRRC